MKLKIKVKLINPICKLNIIDKGEWIDLIASQTTTLNAPFANTLKRDRKNTVDTRNVVFDYKLIPLGVAMKLPKGFEAQILPRSSTFKTNSVIIANSEGVIDNSYNGNCDEWKLPVIAFDNTTICEGERICQFRIQLSQKATVLDKIKWFFSSGVKIEYVDHLGYDNRGGFGSTN